MSLKGHHILCVEDNEPWRAVLASALREFSPEFAASGRDALKALNGGGFDAYVIDVWLPDYNGIPLCREIRRSDPHVPIVCWTVADTADLEARAIRAGADAFVAKSSQYEVLRDTLTRLLQRSADRTALVHATAQQALEEIQKRFASSARYPGLSDEARLRSFQCIARPQVFRQFLAAGGTNSQFESWWDRSIEKHHLSDRCPRLKTERMAE